MYTVLVVENNPVYLKLLDHFLTEEDCNVMAAKDGLSALNILDNHKPDILITDIIMPKISGDQLCKIIRKSPTNQDIFLVVLSSIFIEENTTISELNADLCIAKGTKITLKKCVQKILSNYKNGIRYQRSVVHPEKLPSSAITQELLSARRHYETFFNHLADAVVELNPSGQIIHANHAASILFGKDTSDLLSLYMMDLIKGPCGEEIKTWIKTVTKNTPATFKSSYKTPLSINEKLIFLHLVSVPEGEEIYVTATIKDITERKQTEQQLNKTHSHLMLKNREIESMNTLLASTLSEYEHIFENGHLGIMIFKDGRHLSRCNKRLSSLLGYNAPKDLLGLHLSDIYSSNKKSKNFSEVCNEKIQANNMEKTECQLLKKDKSTVWCLLSGKALDPCSPADLNKGIVWIVDDISERKLFEQKIQHQAYYDSLTGLPNRLQLLSFLEREISMANRHQQNGALLFIDLDNFKTINDSLGHSTGDKLLKLVAERIANNLRKEDVTSRMGGDEFVIILPNLDNNSTIAAKKSLEIATKICNLLARSFFIDGQELHVTISIGVSLIPTQNTGVEDILKQADTAMYRAKSAGRNTVRFFLPSMQKAADERLLMNTEIKKAILNNELTVYYQPQVNNNNEIVGAEALIRWNHPTRGFISPLQFIPIAEETGIIKDIGYWVLQNTCTTIEQWVKKQILEENQTIAVNFSPREFAVSDFVERITHILEKTGAQPNFLNIELTEGSLVSSFEDTVKKIMELRDLGIKFSIDDFGTGYSSLSYLQKLPLNTLKIDRVFITDICNTERDSILVDTIIMMAKNLGLKVIAEGVEKEEEVAYLSSRGCTVYQGYYYCKPIPSEDFEQLLIQGKIR